MFEHWGQSRQTAYSGNYGPLKFHCTEKRMIFIGLFQHKQEALDSDKNEEITPVVLEIHEYENGNASKLITLVEILTYQNFNKRTKLKISVHISKKSNFLIATVVKFVVIGKKITLKTEIRQY